MTEERRSESTPGGDQEHREFREETESLWRITLAPATWAAHFVASYSAAAVVCAKAPDQVAALRLGIGALTVVAIALIAWLGWRSWQQWDVRRTGDRLNARGEAEDRHHFLGHAAVLLSLISGVGVLYVAMPTLFIGTCQ